MKRNHFFLREFQKKVKELIDEKNISLIKEKSRKISSLKDKLNVFEMIGMGRREIKHSYFLRWLCGNYEHGFRHKLFSLFLSEIYKDDTDFKKYIKDESKILEIPLKEKTIKECYKKGRGYGKCQLDFFAIDKINKKLFVIEVKIDHNEGEDQLQRYYKYCTEKYKGYEKKFIFLTENGINPDKNEDKKNWESVSYKQLDITLQKFLRQENISNEYFELAIMSYKEFLTKPSKMKEMNNELKDLCEKIWFKHRDVLGALIKYRPEPNKHAGGLLKLLEDNDNKPVTLYAPYKEKYWKVKLETDVKLHYEKHSYKHTNDFYNYALKNKGREEDGLTPYNNKELKDKATGDNAKAYVSWLKDKTKKDLDNQYLKEQEDYKALSEKIKELKKGLKEENNKLFDRLEIFISS